VMTVSCRMQVDTDVERCRTEGFPLGTNASASADH
jgi:hypothetical protein